MRSGAVVVFGLVGLLGLLGAAAGAATAVAALKPFQHLDGTTTSVVATSLTDTATATALLHGYDPAMELDTAAAEAFGYAAGTYPLMWMMNNMTNLYTTPVNILGHTISQYYEWIAMLPFAKVTKGGSSVAGGVTLQLYLNDVLAVTGGRLYYGMPKTLARAYWAPDDVFTANSEVKLTPLMNAEMTGFGKSLQTYAEFEKAMPLWTYFMSRQIFQRSPDPLESAGYLCFKMPMDWEKTRFSPANVTLSVFPGALAGLPNGINATIGAVTNPSPKTNIGAFYLRDAHWELSAPWTSCF